MVPPVRGRTGHHALEEHSESDAHPRQQLASTKDAVKLMTARLERTVQTMRDVRDEVDEGDPTSADLLHAAIERLEQLAWMVNAETMTPQAAVAAPADE